MTSSRQLKEIIIKAFSERKRPSSISITSSRDYPDKPDVDFLEAFDPTSSNRDTLMHATYGIAYLNASAKLYFLPFLLNGTVEDRFGYRPILDSVLNALKRAEGDEAQAFLEELRGEEKKAIALWLDYLEENIPDYSYEISLVKLNLRVG